MKANQEMVEVRIQATERIEYFQTVSMPRATFEKLNAALDSDNRQERKRAEGEIEGGWINTSDICGVDNFELETFELAKDDA